MTRLSKIFEFDLDTGTDIEQRFKPYKVSNIKQEIKKIDAIPDSWGDLEE